MEEFLTLPVGASCFREAMHTGAEFYHNLKNVIKEKDGKDATNVGDEGGFVPAILVNKEAGSCGRPEMGRPEMGRPATLSKSSSAWMWPPLHPSEYDLDFMSPDDSGRYIMPNQLADLYKSFIR